MEENNTRYVVGDLADRLDLIQRNYINNSVNLVNQRHLGSQRNLITTANALNLSEYDGAASLDHN